MTMEDIFGEPISVYTRAQAIEDGTLVDVSPFARGAGYLLQTCFTRALFDWLQQPDPADQELLGRRIRAVLEEANPKLMFALVKADTFAEFDTWAVGPHDVRVLWVVVDGDGVTIMFPADN